MRSSYTEEDVIILLKDITGIVKPQPTQEREKLIQSGKHYSEMLPIEYVPSPEYMEAYREALKHYSGSTAEAVALLAEKIIKRRGKEVVLVSLARAGIPIGILVKRYLKQKYQVEVPHYAISIIRGRGIDDNAMRYILDRHPAQSLLFVDGWIGKGAILGELEKSVKAYEGVSPELAVAADPANITELCGTHEDILIPSSCLNSTVSGLISRTFLRDDVIGKSDFHGAVYYGELKDSDLSYDFITSIEKEFPMEQGSSKEQGSSMEQDMAKESCMGKDVSVKVQPKESVAAGKGIDEVRKIAEEFSVEDINLVKPGIGETTRVLLRRVPWKILIQDACREDEALTHICRLAEEKGAEIMYYPLKHYKACGIIKKLADT